MVGGGAAVAGANDRTSAELYDPGSGTWTSTGSMLAPRLDFSATLLADGKVLVAGGAAPARATSAELYDPVSGTWSPTGSMVGPCECHTAMLLLDGKVLVAGGHRRAGQRRAGLGRALRPDQRDLDVPPGNMVSGR